MQPLLSIMCRPVTLPARCEAKALLIGLLAWRDSARDFYAALGVPELSDADVLAGPATSFTPRLLSQLPPSDSEWVAHSCGPCHAIHPIVKPRFLR